MLQCYLEPGRLAVLGSWLPNTVAFLDRFHCRVNKSSCSALHYHITSCCLLQRGSYDGFRNNELGGFPEITNNPDTVINLLHRHGEKLFRVFRCDSSQVYSDLSKPNGFITYCLCISDLIHFKCISSVCCNVNEDVHDVLKKHSTVQSELSCESRSVQQLSCM